MASFPKIPLPWDKIAAFALDQLVSRIGIKIDTSPLQHARLLFAIAKSHGDIADTPRTQKLERELMVALEAELQNSKSTSDESTPI